MDEEKKGSEGSVHNGLIDMDNNIAKEPSESPLNAGIGASDSEPAEEEQRSKVFSQPDLAGVRFYSMDGERNQQKKGHMKKGLIIFGIIVAVILVLAFIINWFSSDVSSSSGNVYPTDSYIARLNIEGTIASSGGTDYFGSPVGYQHQWTLDTIDELMDDENNKGLVLFVNSPGGGVYESDELYFKIREYQEHTGRPVYSAMGTMAASGGYYISAPCDKIIANRNCWTGSIGVTLGTMYDFSGLLERYGVKTNTITSGANKAMGSPVDPMTDEQRQILQSLVDDAYDQFVGLVAEGRQMDEQKVRALADGRIYTAKQALSLGLIDAIGTYDEAVADMQDTYDLRDCDVVELDDEEVSLLSSLFGNVELPAIGAKGDVASIVELMNEGNEFPISYMCNVLKK
ncbi:signal peptide peptidase SppA [Aminipila butyrica]|uniref:Signal peptide peptidase SppA n=1 Tax=Aminipila butyrica TaxID=433296 RepID=A0A858BVC2_9FIRM|nr:signal peptide peptidase SppA [Aminipila butyrica]QIB69005.1 signal peptide peptidase SppA [Aminipila butyrica]